MKKLVSSMLVVALFGCLTIPAFAMYGSVIADSTMTVGGITKTTIKGTGSAEEVVADKDDVMNIYAKTVIIDPDNYVLAEDQVTNHYVRQAYNSCSTSLDKKDLKLGVYSVSTLAATRYTDNTTNNDIDIVGEEILIAVRSADPELSEPDGYINVPIADLSNGDGVAKNSVGVPRSTLLDIYSQHFIRVGVGDKIPQLYVKTDGSECYIVDENCTDGVTTTYYKIDNGVATCVD